MKSCKFLLLLLCVALVSASSCKKKSKNSSVSYKLGLVDVTHSSAVQHYHIIYDQYNNVDSINIVGGGADTGSIFHRTFTYYNGGYTIDQHNGTAITYIATSSSGIITSIYMPNDSANITYTGTEPQIVKTKVPNGVSPFYTIIETDYIWNNGDIVSVSTPNSYTDSIVYGPRGGQIGDLMRINDFLSYGQAYIKPAHMAVQINSSGTWLEKAFYQYDGQGRITQLIKVTNGLGVGLDDSTIYSYQYYAF